MSLVAIASITVRYSVPICVAKATYLLMAVYLLFQLSNDYHVPASRIR